MFSSSLIRFHDEEDGLEALQVVVILAIAAVALLVIKRAWPMIREWFGDSIDELTRM